MRANTVRMPPWMWDELDAESDRLGISQGEIIRHAVQLRWHLLALAEAQRAGHSTGRLWRQLLAGARRDT